MSDKYKLANGWTKQTVMDQIKKFNDGFRATITPKNTDAEPKCAYETPGGNRCAVGCFIPSGHAALKTPYGACQVMVAYPELQKLMPFNEALALAMFQNAHDNASIGEVYESVQDFLDTYVE